MTPERFKKIQTVLSRRQPDLTVLTDEVHKQHNMSAIIRSCDAFGVPEVHCVWPSDEYRTFNGTAAGSGDWVKVNTHCSTESAIVNLQKQGFKVCAAHFSDKAIAFRDYDFTQPTAILMGAELEGVNQKAAQLCDEHLIIPMQGMVQSFNVSVATSLLLAEAQYQREQAGMYSTMRMKSKTYQKTCFEWAHPKLAKLCQKNNLPYPELDDNGELIDAQAFSEALKSN